MHVPSVSDYKTNRGGRKKERKRENCIVRKTLPSSMNAKIEFLDITFLNPNLLFREFRDDIRSQRIFNDEDQRSRSSPFSAIQFGFNQLL